MRRLRQAMLAGVMFVLAACESPNINPPTVLPEASTCSAPVAVQAWAAPSVSSSGSVTVFGTTTAPDGVTVRAVYVGGMPVTETDFNFRSWQVVIGADRLAALAHDGSAALAVVALTSDGCAELATPVLVRVGSTDGGAVDVVHLDGSGDGHSDKDAAPSSSDAHPG